MVEDTVTSRRVRDALPVFTALASVLLALAIATTLYLAREILVPIAFAIILSFLLAPLVRLVQRPGIPRSVAVVGVVLLAVGGLITLGGVMAGQMAQLAAELPQHRPTMEAKVRSLRGATLATGALGRTIDMLEEMAQDLQHGSPTVPESDARAASRPSQPVPVEVLDPEAGPLETLGRLAWPLLSPLATAGLIVVFAVFILVQREDLRNRMIRLAGTSDLQKTTAAIDDAASRLSRLFLTQLAVNAGFGLVVATGLWLIGVPSPALWGILGAALRFVPYVGALIAAAFPAAVAAIVDPGWSMLAWTAALFLLVEAAVANALEPLVYGHSSGLSPVAVMLAATVWAFLWGPVGLILATPLTVCLVVLGRHIDRLRFLDVMLGDRPPLSPPQIFYQRMLAGDPGEAVAQAREFLKHRALWTYYDEVALEGLRLAQEDVARGTLTVERQATIRTSVRGLVTALARVVGPKGRRRGAVGAEVAAAVEVAGEDRPVAWVVRRRSDLHPAWRGEAPVLCVAGSGPLEEGVALMLAQLLGRHGLAARVAGPELLTPPEPASGTTGVVLVCLSFLDALSTAHVRLAVRRLRRQAPGAKVMVGLWRQRDPATLEDLRRATSADVLVTSLHAALAAALALSAAVDGPDQGDQRGADHDDQDGERQAEPGVVAEPVAAGAHHQGVALVADGREEVAAGAERHGHEERVGVQAQLAGERAGDRA